MEIGAARRAVWIPPHQAFVDRLIAFKQENLEA